MGHENRRRENRREREGARGACASLRVAGLLGTVSGKWANPWGAPEDLVLEVHLDDGRTRLFWNHELESLTEGA